MDQRDRNWLLSKEIPLSEVFDASGMKLSEYGAAMRLAGKYVAINVTPCKKAGHRIRTRTGKCMVCDIKQYAYSRRYRTAGFVYLAASRQSGLIKVGMSINLENRLNTIRHRKYGGVSDWTLVASIEVDGAGKHEAAVQAQLQAYQATGYYFDGDHKQSCHELFQCDLSTAVEAFRKVGKSDAITFHVDLEGFQSSEAGVVRHIGHGQSLARPDRKEPTDVVFPSEAVNVAKPLAGRRDQVTVYAHLKGASRPAAIATNKGKTGKVPVQVKTSVNKTDEQPIIVGLGQRKASAQAKDLTVQAAKSENVGPTKAVAQKANERRHSLLAKARYWSRVSGLTLSVGVFTLVFALVFVGVVGMAMAPGLE